MSHRREHPDQSLIALGIQQPWGELILRGVKTIEVRSQPTQIRGTIYLYSSKRVSMLPAALDAAKAMQMEIESLPKGLLIGTVEILGSRPCTPDDAAAACLSAELLRGRQAWLLGEPRRLRQPLEVRFLPYGVWFYPFHRRNEQRRRAAARR